jgi:hypothetical protein
MGASPAKPQLLFFRTNQPDLPSFIKLHLEQHVRCLSQFFKVEVISGDCDYDQVCDTYQPDLSLFESGVYSRKHEICNVETHRDVPKIGFLDADAYCESRAIFLADMARWGVETFFTLSVAMAEYTPEIADRLFVWPNFIDDQLFHDYEQPKTIPVLFTGSQAKHYPWRNRISNVVTAAYPTMTCPHLGWFDQRLTFRMLQGEAYAKLLNSAHVVPTCGTIAHEVVRKHFEIPAAGACLMTERAKSLLAAGFVDMENCVFADEDDVLDKLDYLFSKPEELVRITNAGYELVHSRHTARQRDELLQWLNLRKGLAAEEKIVQAGPFAALEVVANRRDANNAYVISSGVDRELLLRGETEQEAGNYEAAQHLYRRCLNYHFMMREPILKLSECALAMGRPAEALEHIRKPISQSLEVHVSHEPDPVEWACFIRALLCNGDLHEAARRAFEFSALHHEELNRMRSALCQVSRGPAPDLLVPGQRRVSVHKKVQQSSHGWLIGLCRMLDSCGQHSLSRLLRSREQEFQSTLEMISRTSLATSARDVAEEDATIVSLPRIGWSDWIRRATWTDWVRSRLRPWRQRFFGPDNFGRLAQQLAEQEPVKLAYIVGSSPRRGFHRTVIKGFMANPSGPVVYSIPASQQRSFFRTTYELLGRPWRRRGADFMIRDEFDASDCDLIFILGEAAAAAMEVDRLSRVRVVVIDGISGQSGQEAHEQISELDGLTLAAYDPTDGDGYAVYRQVTHTVRPRPKLTVGETLPAHASKTP